MRIPPYILLARQKSAQEYSKKNPPKEKIIKICCVVGCDRECDSFSFCNKHYQEWLQYGRIRSPEEIKSLDGEEWRSVKGYEKLYKVSNYGRVLSLPRNASRRRDGKVTPIRVSAKILKPDIDSKGYCRAHLSKNGSAKSILVHRLVAQAFIPNPNDYPQVNHLDCNPSNNRVDNLEWCNQSMQEIHKLHTTFDGNTSLVYQPVKIRCVESGMIFLSIGDASRASGIPYHVLYQRLISGGEDPFGAHWERVV